MRAQKRGRSKTCAGIFGRHWVPGSWHLRNLRLYQVNPHVMPCQDSRVSLAVCPFARMGAHSARRPAPPQPQRRQARVSLPREPFPHDLTVSAISGIPWTSCLSWQGLARWCGLHDLPCYHHPPLWPDEDVRTVHPSRPKGPLEYACWGAC